MKPASQRQVAVLVAALAGVAIADLALAGRLMDAKRHAALLVDSLAAARTTVATLPALSQSGETLRERLPSAAQFLLSGRVPTEAESELVGLVRGAAVGFPSPPAVTPVTDTVRIGSLQRVTANVSLSGPTSAVLTFVRQIEFGAPAAFVKELGIVVEGDPPGELVTATLSVEAWFRSEAPK